MKYAQLLFVFSLVLLAEAAYSASAMLTLTPESESRVQTEAALTASEAIVRSDIEKIKGAIVYQSQIVANISPTPTPVAPADLILSDSEFLGNKSLAELEELLEQRKKSLRRLTEEESSSWIKKFGNVGVGKGVSFAPAGTGQQYKVELVRYNLKLGDNVSLPFMMAYGESTSDDAQDKNTLSLVDPTDGLSVTFPFYFDLGDWNDDFCRFEISNGFCRVGAEFNGAYKKYETVEGESDYDFGMSAQVALAFRFPIELMGDITKAEALCMT